MTNKHISKRKGKT